MELVNGNSLLNFLKSKPNRKIEEHECKEIFSQIVKAISHCHNRNICHRDIKLENIIVDDSKFVKIIDFGFGTVTVKDKLQNFFCGTPSYMPPEIVQKKDYIGKK
jgi:serine/threonine protein kinase